MDAHSIAFLELFNGQVQYVVPRWQRRYCWGQSDIERLVEDLLTVARARSNPTHYGGTLLTFPESSTAGVVNRIRVVDGQQRLTTVSILLACIAERLGPDGNCDDWTAEVIRNDRLTNPGKPSDKIRKLKLQDRDEDEYRSGLDGFPNGAGAITQAWGILRRLVAQNDVALILKGLGQLRVVSIGVKNEDPQQIFESLNATGRPLTESEKVKNWLLMGLPDNEQQDLHDNYWLQIEKYLGAEYSNEPIDLFLRDMLRWQTGEIRGIDQTYEAFRRWAIQNGKDNDRPAICHELTRLAGLYGVLTGTTGKHSNPKVERELRHLRNMGIDIHRPLILRLLNDVSQHDEMKFSKGEEFVQVLKGIGTWTTRLWLADRQTPGMNRAIAELAHGRGPTVSEKFSQYWLGCINKFRNSRIGVPSDEDIREGIRNRKAYGGRVTKSTFAVLYALVEHEHGKESPATDYLTVEHVMPRTLTNDWKSHLGEKADEIHGKYLNQIANLTLSGINSELGNSSFDVKRIEYEQSPIGITRRIAYETEWNIEALERRSEDLAERALECWPWSAGGTRETSNLRWRIEQGPWRNEQTASQMVLNVASALLSQNSGNADQLSSNALSFSVLPANIYPPNTMIGSLIMRAIPEHNDYVLYPYERDYTSSAKRCQEMGRRCGVEIDVEISEVGEYQKFWNLLMKETGGVPGQKDSWRGPDQCTKALNSSRDYIRIYIGNPDLLWLYIRAGESEISEERTRRMLHYSRQIENQMGDQKLGSDFEKNSKKGWSISVQRNWIGDDEDNWLEAIYWIKQQQERLEAILNDELTKENN